jgi:hypothetical protein
MMLSAFRQIFIRPHLTNGLGVMITTSQGEGVLLKISSGQTKSFEQIRTLRLLSKGIWKNTKYKDPREFITFLMRGRTQCLVETDNFQDMIILVGIDFAFLFGLNFR